MTTKTDYIAKARTDYEAALGIAVRDASLIHDGRQNTIVKIEDAGGQQNCVRYRTAVEFWYEDCIKEPFMAALGVVDVPAVRHFNDGVRPQILISEFVEGPLLHVSGVSDDAATRVGRAIAALHVPSNGASTYLDFTQGKKSSETWVSQFLASLREEAVASGFDESDVADLNHRCGQIFPASTQNTLVLVHNDIHFKNLIQRPNGSICFIDWDSAVIAPPEKDFVKLLDWSHENTGTVPKIIRAYEDATGRPLNTDIVEAFRIYACLRQIHYQAASIQKGVDSAVLAQQGFFDDNKKHHQRMCQALNRLGLPDWRLPNAFSGAAWSFSSTSGAAPK